MKLSDFYISLEESFKHYTVKHKHSGKTYKVTAMHDKSAKEKARQQHGGTASRYTGTSTDDFEIVEGIKDLVKGLKGPGYYSLDKDNPDHPADISDKLRKKLKQKDEGKSPHKKGTKKYKKHMAAMHAGMGEASVGAPDYNPARGGYTDNMIGEPDDYYDAEERQEAYDDLQDALQGNYMDDYIKDGDCPACGGTGYMDGEETFTNDDGEEEESSECDGFGNYGCDEGEMTYGNGQPSWVEIIKHDESKAERQKSKDEYPGDEEVIKQVASYMKRMDDPRMAYQQMQADFPFMGRGQRSEILGKASKMAFGEGVMDMDWKSASELEDLPMIKSYNTPEENAVSKILGRALMKKDWEKYSPQELFSELESENPELADDIAKIAKIVYKVQLEERAYKDVGVADVQTDPRGKEFKFNKDTKKFKAIDDEEEADPKTKTGKELMRKRRNAMKKSSPSYNKKPAPKKGGFLSNLFNDVMNEGEERSIIQNACIEKLVDEFAGEIGQFENKDDLEYAIYQELERLDVSDCVDPEMEVGGQPIGDFASGRVIDVINSSDVIYDVMQHMDLSQLPEGKSPHKKGTKKYKKHMAAIHAGEGVKDIVKSLKGPKYYSLDKDAPHPTDDLDKLKKKLKSKDKDIDEAEYNGKDVELNKPKRGGSKKYYVYVKNPKTDRVKKISFGDVTGLKTKANNKKRAKSFAARHNCEKKNDKMKAGYWACRLPRYGLVKGGKWW